MLKCQAELILMTFDPAVSWIYDALHSTTSPRLQQDCAALSHTTTNWARKHDLFIKSGFVKMPGSDGTNMPDQAFFCVCDMYERHKMRLFICQQVTDCVDRFFRQWRASHQWFSFVWITGSCAESATEGTGVSAPTQPLYEAPNQPKSTWR